MVDITHNTDMPYKKLKSACAVVCEYDPFHTGHRYHLQQSKLQSGCDYVVCIMSGSITQRCTLPIVDKYTRAKHALSNGADLVVQLPSVYSTANAQVFAQGAIKIASQLDFVTHVSFGVENTNLEINKVAHLLDNTDFGTIIARASKYGVPYPVALMHAMREYYPNTNISNADLQPNTILAIEYIRAISQYCPHVKTVSVVRTSDFGSQELEHPYTSASAIRRHILLGDILQLQEYLPYNIQDINSIPDNKIYSGVLVSTLKNTSLPKLKRVHSISEGLEYRLATVAKKHSDLDQIIHYTKSKRYLYSRIKRSIVQNYLSITKDLLHKSTQINAKIPFRVLGINKDNIQLLGSMPEQAIVKNTDIYCANTNPLVGTYYVDKLLDIGKEIINRDILADNLYSVCTNLNKDLYFGIPLIKV